MRCLVVLVLLALSQTVGAEVKFDPRGNLGNCAYKANGEFPEPYAELGKKLIVQAADCLKYYYRQELNGYEEFLVDGKMEVRDVGPGYLPNNGRPYTEPSKDPNFWPFQLRMFKSKNKYRPFLVLLTHEGMYRKEPPYSLFDGQNFIACDYTIPTKSVWDCGFDLSEYAERGDTQPLVFLRGESPVYSEKYNEALFSGRAQSLYAEEPPYTSPANYQRKN